MFKGTSNRNNGYSSNIIRGAICARVSSDEQTKNNSLPTQVSESLQLAERFGIEVLEEHIFRDDISGDTWPEKRPQLHRLFTMIRKGQIDAVIVHSSDRLARKAGPGESILDYFIKYGIRLFITYHMREFVLTNSYDYDVVSAEFQKAKYWKAMLLEGMNRGKRGKAARGKYVGWGNAPFGYDKDGKGELIVIDDEAAIIQNIYYWFVEENVGVTEITRRLKGTSTPIERNNVNATNIRDENTKPGTWRDTAIYRILRNPIYKGEITQYGEFTMSCPAIIDESLWEAAQTKLNNGKKNSFRGAKHDYLMRNRMRCDCGYTISTQPMHKQLKSGETKTHYYYTCQSLKKERPKFACRLPRHMPRDLIDDVVWGYMSELIKHPETIRQKLKESQAKLDERNRAIQERIDQLNAMKQKQANKANLLVDQYSNARNEEVKAMFTRLLEETESLFNEVNAELDELTPQLRANSITDEFIDDWVRYAKALRKRVENADFNKRRETIESLNVNGTLTVEDDTLVLYLHIYTHTERLPIDMVVTNRHTS